MSEETKEEENSPIEVTIKEKPKPNSWEDDEQYDDLFIDDAGIEEFEKDGS